MGFFETNPFGGSVGDWTGPVFETALRAFDLCVPNVGATTVVQQDARKVAAYLPVSVLVATDHPITQTLATLICSTSSTSGSGNPFDRFSPRF